MSARRIMRDGYKGVQTCPKCKEDFAYFIRWGNPERGIFQCPRKCGYKTTDRVLNGNVIPFLEQWQLLDNPGKKYMQS